MTVLLITYGVPLPAHGGAGLRDFQTLQCLSREHKVILLCHTWAGDERYLPELRRYCEAADFVSVGRSLPQKLLALVRGALAGRPAALFPFYFEEMAGKIRDVFANREIGLVQIEQSFLAPYIDAAPSPRPCPAVLSFHNVAARQYRTMVNMDLGLFQKALYRLKAAMMARWEERYLSRFDRLIAVSPAERDFLRSRIANVPVSLVPNSIDPGLCPTLPEPDGGNTVLLAGNMEYAPNVDAALYFCRKIFPLVRETVPDATLLVMGRKPPREVAKLGRRPGVVITGTVPDVTPYYAHSRAAVVPLRAGGGTRFKILEAMALGRAVVSTSLGCEGLEVRNGEDILIADTPRAFADGVARLLLDPELNRRLRRNARALVQSRYAQARMRRELIQAIFPSPAGLQQSRTAGQ